MIPHKIDEYAVEYEPEVRRVVSNRRASKLRKLDFPRHFECAKEMECGCAMKLRRLRHFRRASIVVIALALLSSSDLSQGGETQEPENAMPRPAWLHEMPLVIVSNHDSMPIFQRRRGGNPAWQEDDYEKEHTDEAIEKLKELGERWSSSTSIKALACKRNENTWKKPNNWPPSSRNMD